MKTIGHENYRSVCATALLAGMAGTFLIPQAAFAGPTGEHGVASNINIQRPDAVTTTITSTALNNVIKLAGLLRQAGRTCSV